MRALDLYSSVNLIAFERQLEALERVSSKGSKDKKRYPLWEPWTNQTDLQGCAQVRVDEDV